MKVLLCAPQSGGSGGMLRWTEHLQEYYKKQNNLGFQLDILDTGLSMVRPVNPSITYRIITGLREYSRIYRVFCHRINSNSYDKVHLTTSASISLFKDLVMLHKAKSKGLSTILHFHFGRIPDLQKQNNWEWKLLIKCVKLADKVVVIDLSSYEVLRDCGFKHIYNIPNPLAPQVEAFVQKNQASYSRVKGLLLFVGHVVRTKGVYELIDACKDFEGIRLKLIGPVLPSVKSELLSIAQNNRGDWIDIAGDMHYVNVLQEMMKCELFILPTYTEGFPNVILESMACGCPIVTTAVGAIPEMLDIKNGFNHGICVEPRSVSQLKRAIEKMLNEHEYARQCGLNAQTRVNAMYTMPYVWEQLEKVWTVEKN